MGKIAFLFPGQGAQYVGMGKELYENFDVCKEVFHKAEEALGYSLTEVCFDSSEEFLSRTDNTQPALLTVSTAILRLLEEKGITYDVTAGLSLGEYSALVCSGILNFEDALKLVRKRGQFMQQAAEKGNGTLAAVIGLSLEAINEVVKEAKEFGIVEISNLNCPGQIVIGGEIQAIDKAVEIAENKGAKKVVKLKVSGPFHTSMLEEAAIKLEEEFKKIDINDQKTPIVMNLTGEYLKEDSNLVEIMKNQVTNTVQFEKSIRTMIDSGVDTFVEVGPSRVLSGFVKKVDRKLKVLNIEDIKSLNKTLEYFKEV